MNTFTFRVLTMMGLGGWGGFPLQMQHLHEEQAAIFHLAQQLSLLSLTVNVHNVGKTPRRILTQPSVGKRTTSLKPVFKAAGSTPI